MTNLKHTYIYNIILSLGIGLLIIYFLPSFFSKFQVKLVEQRKVNPDGLIWYADLNNDGFSEKIYRGLNGGSQTPYLKIDDKGGLFLTQWNITGEWLIISPLMIGDYDNNGFSEIFALSFKNDSVFINGYEPYKKNGCEIKSRFVFKAAKSNGNQDWYIKSNNFIDLNNDGYKEVVFTFCAGFTKQPRRVVVYDIRNDSFLVTPFAGSTLNNISYSDIDSDGKPEICGKTFASDNYNEENINLTDTNSYLFIFDQNLELKYPPDTNYGVTSDVRAVPYKNKIASLWIGRTAYNHKSILKIYNNKNGILTNIEKDVSNLSQYNPQMLVSNKDNQEILYIIGENKIFRFDENLKQISNITIKHNVESTVKTLDFENDGTDELLFISELKDKMIIYRNDFTHPVIIDIAGYPALNPKVNIRRVKGKHSQVSIQYGQNWYLYKYFENPNYIYRWPSYFMIFFLLFVFFQLLLWFYKGRIQKQYETERKLMELQLLTVKNQMNPHFTFNALNSISSIIYKENKKLAHDFLTRFSDLIRSTLENAESISINLDAELKFVENYLELEKFRFKDKFDYSIDIKDDIDIKTPIPRMIIQTFVENALKHGLMHKEKDGLLNIRLWKKRNQLLIEIEDNGIGRKKAKEVSLGSTGKGLKIIEQIVHLYKKLLGKEINYKVIDLFKDETATGTKVIIEVNL